MTAPVSACMVTRGEETLERAVDSIRDHVAEVVAVVNAEESENLNDRLADLKIRRWLYLPGPMTDFAAARNESMRLAQAPYLTWLDSDDEVVGAESFREIVKEIEGRKGGTEYIRVLFPYHYDLDDEGRPVVVQRRERLVANSGRMHWVHPVHESLVSKDGVYDESHDDRIIWKHHKSKDERGLDRGRNLRILQHHYPTFENCDSWAHLQLGFEHQIAGHFEDGLRHLLAYVRESNWDDEKVTALLRASDCALAMAIRPVGGTIEASPFDAKRIADAMLLARTALDLKPEWFEPAFALAKLHFLAGHGGGQRELGETRALLEAAIACGPTRTSQPTRPLDIAWHAPAMLRDTCEILQDWAGAVSAIDIMLRTKPEDPGLLLQRKRFEALGSTAKSTWEGYRKGTTIDRDQFNAKIEREVDESLRPIIEARREHERRSPLFADASRVTEKVHHRSPFFHEPTPSARPLTPKLIADLDELVKRSPTPPEEARGKGRIHLPPGTKELPWAAYETKILDNREHERGPAAAVASALKAAGAKEQRFVGVFDPGGVPLIPRDIVIACGDGPEPWNPHLVKRLGIGGSETAVVEMAKRLATVGHKVRVYTNCAVEGLYDGAEWYDTRALGAVKSCDLLIAWRSAKLLDEVSAPVKWLWVHDLEPYGAASEYYRALPTRLLALTEWHKEHLVTRFGFKPEQMTVVGNGIDLHRFEVAGVERDPKKAIYSSSPDRGLDVLLEVWPEIHRRVPGSSLHVFYGFDTLDWALQFVGTPEQREKYKRLRERAKELEPMGVKLRGRVNQTELAQEMLSAGAWVYPTAWLETHCISALEAQAAGLAIVTTKLAALGETVRSGILLDPPNTSEKYKADFINAAEWVLTRGGEETRAWSRREVMESVRDCSWDNVAGAWQRMMDEDFAPRAMATASITAKPIVHLVLAPNASGHVAIDPETAGEEAMGGGCRAGFHGLVRAMARTGKYRLRAFSTYRERAKTVGDVEYLRFDELRAREGEADVVFAYYDTSPLVGCTAPLRIASHHTYIPYMGAWDWTDVNTAPSDHARDHLREAFDPHNPWYTMPNAVELPKGLEWKPVRSRCIYHTSPDRGLYRLLGIWPEVRRRIPEATLHVVGDVNMAIHNAVPRSLRGRRAEALGRNLKAAQAAGGVELLGRLSRADLLRELTEASCFPFWCEPSAPCETFSISLLESCAIGIPIVLRPADALEPIYRDAVMIAEELDQFTVLVVSILKDDFAADSWSKREQAFARRFSFERKASVLDEIITRHLAVDRVEVAA